MILFVSILILALAAVLIPAAAAGVMTTGIPPNPDKAKAEDVKEPQVNHQCFTVDYLWDISQKNATVYKNFRQVGGDPGLALSQMVGRKSAAAFLKLTPHQIAQLVPKIKIWKVKMKQAKSGHMIPDEDPVELKFSDVANWTVDETDTKSVLKSIRERGDGVGIKSVSIETQGTNPAEGALVKVTMEFFFQNPALLVNEDLPPETNYLDLIWYHPAKNRDKNKQPTGKPTDCLASKDVNTFLKYTPNHTKLALEYGWAFPPSPNIFDKGMTPAGQKELTLIKESIKNSSTMIFLDLTTHDIQYNQDGTVVLKADYQGAIQSRLTDPMADILLMNPVEEQRLKNKRKQGLDAVKKAKAAVPDDATTAAAQENYKKRSTLARFGDWVLDQKSPAESQKALKEEQTAVEERQIDIQRDEQTERYSKILNNLTMKSKIMFIDLTEDQIKNWKDALDDPVLIPKQWEELKDKSKKGKYRQIPKGGGLSSRYYRKSPDMLKSITPQPAGKAGVDKEGMANVVRRENPKPGDEPLAKKASKTLFSHTSKTSLPKGSERIYFTYFGDLLEAVLSVLYDDKKVMKDIHFLLGNFRYFDFRGAARDSRDKVLARYINLANVPITLSAFEKYFVDNVIKKNKRTLLVGDFIEDIAEKLLVGAIQGPGRCLGSMPQMGYKVGISVFSGPKAKTKAFERGPKKLITIDDIRTANIKEMTSTEAGNPKIQNYNYFYYIYIVNEAPTMLSGDPKKDQEIYSIYHLAMGEDRGLVKNVSFSKTANPYQGPRNLTSEDAAQSQLRHKYNADVEMIGNSFFHPGAYVYIDPSMAGMGSARDCHSIAYKLGLGGYFSVIKVTTDLDRSGYKTKLQCVWQTFGDGGKKAINATTSQQWGKNAGNNSRSVVQKP